MNIPVKQKIEVPDGAHEGVIVDIEYRSFMDKSGKTFEYTDLIIEFKNQDRVIKLKAGYPTSISDTSKLGKLLVKFGAELKVGEQIDPNKVLIGKKCGFVTMTEETAKGTFARIVIDSVKPK